MSSNEISPEKGMYLVKPHGNLVWTGKKTLIVKEKEFPNMLNIPLYLIEGKFCYGILELTSMRKIWKIEFENRRKKHLITPEEVKAWGWTFPLYSYEYKFLEKYQTPREVEIPQGVQTFVDSKNIEFLISDQDLEAKHLLAHTTRNLDLHLLVHAELTRRGKEHLDLDDLDREQVILLEDIAKYDPTPLTDQVLVNDHRLAHIFANRMREGIKIESKQWSPFALPEQKKMIEHIHGLIVVEMEKRKMKHLTPLAVSIIDITADYCKGLDDEELETLDAFLHKTAQDGEKK